jgi:type IV secretion system protein VirD4
LPVTVAIIAALAVLTVWSTGAAAGVIVAGRLPRLGLDETIGVLSRFPAHLEDPRRAWPAPWSTRLPTAAGFYAVAAVVVTLVGSLVTGLGLVARRLQRRGHRPPPGKPLTRSVSVAGRGRGARWAGRWDLTALRVRRPGHGRLVLGRSGRTLVATEARHSVLVIGPTQSGKTTGLAIPGILEWDGPVLATSVKGDLASITRKYREGVGQTWVFDPTGTAGVGSTNRWSPLLEATTWTGAQRMAAWMVEATPSRGGLADGAFWFSAAAKLLAPLLLAAARDGRTMADVVRWTNLQEAGEPEQILGQAAEIDAGVALFASIGRDERLRSSIYTTLETVLAPYEDPLVAGSAQRPDIDPARLLDGSHTLYLCGPAHEQARIQGVFSALVSSVINAAVERVHLLGHPLDPPLLVVLDEVANIAPLRDLDTLASTAAGMGIQLVTVCQDLAQLTSRYGAERARTIANNHRAKVILSGIGDVGTLDTLSGLAGEQAMREHTLTSDLRDGRRSMSSSTVYRRLAPPDELRRIRPGDGVLVYGYLPPVRLALRPWYRDAVLRARAVGKPEIRENGRAYGRRPQHRIRLNG